MLTLSKLPYIKLEKNRKIHVYIAYTYHKQQGTIMVVRKCVPQMDERACENSLFIQRSFFA